MSGGRFDYNQNYIDHIANDIEGLITGRAFNDNGEEVHESVPEWYTQFSDETKEEFKKGLQYLRKAYVYAQRIDWLVSGDDGEEGFHRRLNEELCNIKKVE